MGSMQTGLSAKHFHEPLLLALAELANWKANVVVQYEDTYAPIIQRMGIQSLDAHGTNDASGQPMVAKWIQWANKAAQGKGLTATKGRGEWVLTQAGLAEARRIQSEGPKQPGKESDVEVAPSPKPEATYHPDPYIRALAAKATPCFGFHSEKSTTCTNCPIQENCINYMAARLTQIALALETEQSLANPTPALPQPGNPTPAPPQPGTGPRPAPTTIPTVQKDARRVNRQLQQGSGSICEYCRQSIPRGTWSIWVRADNGDGVRGTFHEHCINVVG